MREFVMGDIHGCYKALVQVLERAGFNKQEDTLIQLGDVVDGWSQSYECVEELMSIKNLIAIKGNHDDWFNEFLEFGIHPAEWTQGSDATRDSYLFHCEDLAYFNIPKSHRDFFRTQSLYYIDSNNRLFLHAGYEREAFVKDIPKQVHNFCWDRKLWSKALSCAGGQILKTADNFSCIFIGHTTTTNYKINGSKATYPMAAGGVINMDTGCGFDGKLSMMDIGSGEVFQSDLVRELYTKEKGRNR